MPNPIKYADFFDFSDREQITQAIQDMKELKKNFNSFLKGVTGTQIADLNNQLKALSAQVQDVASATKSYNVTTEEEQKKLAQMLQIMQLLRAENKQLKAAMQGVQNVQTAVGDSVNGLSKKLREQVAEFNNLSKSGDKVKMQALAADIRNTRNEIQTLSNATKACNSAFGAAKGSYNELDAKTKQLVRDLKQMEGGMSGTTKEAKLLQKEIFNNTQKLKDFDAKMNQNFRNVGNYKDGLSGLNNVLGSFGVATLSLAGLVAVFNSITDTAAKYQALEAAIRATSDTESEFADNMQFLRVTSETYGQDIETLAGAYKGLNAAARGTAIEGQQTKRIFESIVIAGSALKLSNQQVEGSLLAVQQMISKGKVQAEELRGQLGERLPGAFGLFAKAAGVSTAQLDKMLKDGKIIATDILPKFAQLLKDTYSEQAIANAHQLGNEQNRLANAWDYFTKAFNDSSGFNNAFGGFKKFLADSLNEVTVFLKNPSVKTLIGLFNGENMKRAKDEQVMDFKVQQFANLSAEARAKALQEQNDKLIQANNQRTRKPANSLNGDGIRIDTRGVHIGSTPEERAFQLKEQVFADEHKLYLDYLKKDKELKAEEAENNKRAAKDGEQSDADKEKAEKKRLAALKKYRDEQNQLLQDSARYEIAIRELAYSKTARTAADEESLERDRLAILNRSYEARKHLFDKGSKEYKEILIEQIDAERTFNEKLLQIQERGIAERQRRGLADLEQRNRFAADNYDNEVSYEQAKLDVLVTAFDARLKLYRTDSDDYAQILDEKVKAEQATADKIAEIQRQQQAGKELVGRAQEGQSEGRVNNVQRLKISRGQMSQFDADTQNRNAELAGLTLEINAHQQKLDAMAAGDKEYDQLHAELIQKQTEREKLHTDQIIANEQNAKEKREKLMQALYDGLTQISGNMFEIGREINEARVSDLEKDKERELAAAGNNADAKAKIEENYQKKIVALKRKQAIFDKFEALFSIGLNTAVAVSKAVADSPLTGGMPFSGIAIVIGAAQAAAVLAKPLPKYEKGRRGGAKEWAEVNEAGPELIKDRLGNYRFANAGKRGPTLLQAGDSVITHKESREIFNETIRNQDTEAFIDSLLKGTGVMRAVEKQKEEAMLLAIAKTAVNEKGLAKAFKQAVGSLPLQNFHIDAEGFSEYTDKVNRRGERQKKRNNTFGNG